MKLSRKQIQAEAMKLLEAKPQGVRWMELLRYVKENSPDTPHNSIHGSIHILLTGQSSEIIKIARGTYQLKKYAENDSFSVTNEDLNEKNIIISGSAVEAMLVEKDFYESFADWLIENDEVTHATPLGGNVLGGKWGTPDVIGVLKPRAQDVFRFEQRIVSAEIKVASGQPVVAFGQAVAYRLFSHKSYVVIPRKTATDDMSRLIALCSIHGVGLVDFLLDKSNPDYQVRVIASQSEPDIFYINSMIEKLRSNNLELINKLF